MQFKCLDCGAVFDEEDANTEEVDIEFECGVGGLFPDHHTGTALLCPECDSYDVVEFFPEDEEEEGEEE